MSLPKVILQLEGLVAGTVATAVYFLMHEPGGLFAVLILAPDAGMFGYLVNAKVGAVTYNLTHFYGLPVLLGFLGMTMGYATIPIALIWVAHIGLDRALGFGLKFPSNFTDTDLQRLTA